jgi:hypothetical protein
MTVQSKNIFFRSLPEPEAQRGSIIQHSVASGQAEVRRGLGIPHGVNIPQCFRD